MSGTTWTKFFWADWLSDRGLRRSSYAARGLWMDMLCIAAQGDPIGKLCIEGDPLSATDIARMTGGDVSEVETLIVELERNGVFSRDRNGVIYSRRMTEDAKKAATARKNGKKGGNPSLGKQTENPASDKGQDNGEDKPHKPFASSQEDIDPNGSCPKSASRPSDDEVSTAFDLWNEAAQRLGLPTARKLDKGRRSKLKARLREEGLDGWRRALAMLEQSPHCLGENNSRWRANLDFLLRPDRFNRLLEGAYVRARPNEPPGGEEQRRRKLYAEKGLWHESWGEPPPDITPPLALTTGSQH